MIHYNVITCKPTMHRPQYKRPLKNASPPTGKEQWNISFLEELVSYWISSFYMESTEKEHYYDLLLTKRATNFFIILSQICYVTIYTHMRRSQCTFKN